jgi:hypothetical protein
VEASGVIEVTIEVTSGAVVFEDYSTGTLHEISEGGSQQFSAPVPSLQTVRTKVEVSGSVALKLSGYTDAPFTVQRATALGGWENWMVLNPDDLPTELDAGPVQTGGREFFRLSR